MSNRELIADILEILSIVEDLITLQCAIKFKGASERRTARNSIRLLRLARANALRLMISKSDVGEA